MQITLWPHVERRVRETAKAQTRSSTALVNRVLEECLWGPQAHAKKGILADSRRLSTHPLNSESNS